MSDRVDRFLGSREMVRLRRGSTVVEVPTIGIEALIATKLTRRGDKAKDILDVGDLIAAARRAGRRLDLPAIRRLVEGHDEALELLRQIEERTEGVD